MCHADARKKRHDARTPTPEIVATQADRVANWRTLRELAGLS